MHKTFYGVFINSYVHECIHAHTHTRFLDLGGNEDRGIRALAESYVRLPNMVNVMIEWLHTAGYRKREIQAMVEEHLKSLVLKHFDPKKADLIFTEEGSVSECSLINFVPSLLY